MSDTSLRRYQGRNVLVTGGAGVIGRELLERLVAVGARVLCCDLKPPPEGLETGIEYVEGDANELSLARLEAFDPSCCFHLAATFERTTETPEFWDENFRHNVRLSHHLGGLIRSLPRLRRVVFASSYLIYDPATYTFDAPRETSVELSEDAVIQPRNICGAAKLLHEIELHFLSGFRPELRTVAARIFRVYGRGSRDVVSRWIRSLGQAPELPLTVYRPEGRFDYVYAGDVAEGLLRLGASEATGIVNLGSGRSRSVTELMSILQKRFPTARFDEAESDIPWEAHQADLRRLRDLLNWTPPTSLEDGIALVADHEERVRDDVATRGHVNALVTSASRKVPLVRRLQRVVRSLDPDARVVAADSDPECVAAHFADAAWQMPRLPVLGFDELLAACRQHQVRLLVPTRDGELALFAEYAERLERAGIFVLGSPPAAVELCGDKLAFARTCEQAGLPAIPTAESLEELSEQARAAGRFVVKERAGAGARSLGLDLSWEAALHHAQGLDRPVFQPFLAGVEYSVDLYVDRRGRLIEAVPRERRRVHAGESFVTETVEHRDLVGLSETLAGVLGLRGHAVVQALEVGETLQLVECNPRVGGASELAFEAGLESLRWALMEALGREVVPRPGRYQRGLKLVRYPADRFLP